MSKVLMLALALLVSTAWLVAQDQSPQTGSQQSGAAPSGQTTVKGCLQGSSGSYTLTADSGTTYQLQGDTSKLSEHVGHEVQITGSPSAAASPSSTMSPSAGTSAGGSQQTLTVDNVKHISKSCSNKSK
jgi:uncharacterized protein DUF5818